MYKNFFHSVTKCIIFVSLVSTMANAKPHVVTRILTDNPAIPSADSTKYKLSIAEIFIRSRNHLPALDSKLASNVKSISFSAEVNDSWEYGINYLYSKNKFQMAEDNSIERSTSHDIVPYGTYFFNADTSLTVLGGGRFAPIKITQNSNEPVSGKTRANTAILGAEFSVEKNLGLWNPSVNIGMLYENEKTYKYILTDGSVTNKQWIHFLMGQGTVNLGVNIHENFQPYVKTGYQLMLRRSTSYMIQNWGGWLVGGGVNLFSAEKWNTGLDYEYNKAPNGDRQNSFMLNLAVNF